MGAKILFVVIAKRWRDKMNGNTYHSVRIVRTSDGAVITSPYQYGYGDHYRQTALTRLKQAEWISAENIFAYERENDYPILWVVSDGLKRECVANGKE